MPDQNTDPGHGQNYWRSLQELADSDEFRRHLENEFPGGVGLPEDGLSRRRFLQIMAASVAMAGVAGCRWPEETIVPFSHRPAGVVPGRSRLFASALEIGGQAFPVLATSFDGRPIKVDGNPDLDLSGGAASAVVQAGVLDLYDPDRSRGILRRSGRQTLAAGWDEVLAFLAEQRSQLTEDAGEGLAILAEASTSPSRAALQAELRQRYPQMRWYEHEPVDRRAERDATRLVFGRPHRVLPDLSTADVVVDLDADLLHDHPTAVRNARQFARRRRPVRGAMNRLYVFEPTPTVTGAMADHHQPTPATEIPAVLYALAAELHEQHGLELPDGLAVAVRSFAGGAGDRQPLVAALARDLAAHRGAILLAAGPRQPARVHAACAALNEALDGAGRTVSYLPDDRDDGTDGDLPELVRDLAGGGVRLLVILGGNPVYTAPGDLDLASALPRAGASLHLSLQRDATSRLCTWHVNRSHWLESWGDLVAPDGTYLAQQPLISPLYDGRSDLELLSALIAEAPLGAHDIVRRTFHRHTGGRGQAPADDPRFEERWRRFVHDGFLAGSTPASAQPRVQTGGRWDLSADARRDPGTAADAGTARVAGNGADAGTTAAGNRLELVIAPSPAVHDGRFANNAWLQELPDFLTKLTWDNAALLAPVTAAALDLEDGDVVTLERGGAAIELPVLVLPGQDRRTVTVHLGYGRRDAGRVGDGVGASAYRLRTVDAPHGGPGLRLEATGREHKLATTQDHHVIDPLGYQERERRVGSLVREANLDEHVEHPGFVDHLGIHHPPLQSLWKEWEYEGHKWGMSIDLNVCTGCNACVVACQAENNIPVVGKDEVERGREMHWIRIDRYFKGEPDAPQVAHQPVACVHCEMAPCESVCPVAATLHTAEGLNAMVYNRCIGTRYCSNNCPYKVRRFNWFDNAGPLTEMQKMVMNPDVTVRSRGVMEKCTYCVQRIENARIEARNERRPIRDGEIVPACAQTCPTEAIVFGDLNDRDSRVSGLREDSRAYDLLTYLNTKPRTHYLARIRNPNPELVPADQGAREGPHDAAPGATHDTPAPGATRDEPAPAGGHGHDHGSGAAHGA
ncbi:MAG: TAT-variant-translocated molybdopterin oxidoreductase [Candidatus Krumholzibacteriia bacterium]